MTKSLSLVLMGAMALMAANENAGRRAPSFSLPDMNMKQHDILDYRGKVLIVEFMQTKCQNCQTLTKMFDTKIKPKYGDKLSVLSIVVPPDTFDVVKKYVDVFKTNTPILFDMGQVAGSYVKASPDRPAMYFPHIFLIDQNGQIRGDWQWSSGNLYPDILSGDKLMMEIDKLIAEGGAGATPAAAKTPAKKK